MNRNRSAILAIAALLSAGTLTACQQAQRPSGSAPTSTTGGGATATSTPTSTTGGGATATPTPTSTTGGGVTATPTPRGGAGGGDAAPGRTGRLSVAGLKSAPYPRMCGNPAGRLKDGKHTSPSGNVFVNAPGVMDWYNPGSAPKLVDLDRDGVKELVAEFDCDQGGVTWPTVIVVYRKGWEIVGSINLGTQREYAKPVAKAGVTRWAVAGHGLSVRWKTGESPIPTDSWRGRLVLSAGKPDLVGVTGGPVNTRTSEPTPSASEPSVPKPSAPQEGPEPTATQTEDAPKGKPSGAAKCPRFPIECVENPDD